MIFFSEAEIGGWKPAIRGMRNALNSWHKSDSFVEDYDFEPYIGPNDMNLMKHLTNAGPDHAKFRRMISVYVDITAPLYWWKEFDTYKVGTVSLSCSTMHTICSKTFDICDFSSEHIQDFDGKHESLQSLEKTIETLNHFRDLCLQTKDKDYWWQLIQLLPSSYNQKRTIMMNYEVLAKIYHERRNHKLDEWRDMCKWIEELPSSWIITGGDNHERAES